MAVSMIGPKFYAWDSNGKPLAFGKLYTYQARTNTPKPTYQSEDQVVENTNPVILNGEGYANVYLDGAYKMVLKDDKENEIWTSDPVTAAQAEEWVNCLPASYVSPDKFKVSGNFTDKYDADRVVRVSNGASLYSYSKIESSSYAGGFTTVILLDPVVTTSIDSSCTSIIGKESIDINNSVVKAVGGTEGRALNERFSDFIDIKDFGAKGDGLTDDTLSIQNALDYAKENNIRVVLANKGKFKYTSIIADSVGIKGDGIFIKDEASDYGLIMLGSEPLIDGIRFEPENTARNPSCDIKLGDGCYNPTIRNCVFYSPNGQTIYSAIGSATDPVVDPGGDFPYSQNIRKLQITNNIFEGYTRPVYLFCLDGYSITDNRFEGSDFDAVRIREVVGDGNISDNLFINVGDTSAGDEQTRDAIDTAWSGFNLTIANNTIKGIAYVGIDVKGTSATADYGSGWITITGNYIEDTHLSGIAVSGVGRFNISNNMLKGCNNSQASVGDAAILFKDNDTPSYLMARGNMVTSNFGRGIYVEGGNSHVILSENICQNNSDAGIQIVCNYGVVTHNQCVNDSSLANGDAQVYGITFAGSASSINSVIVEGNICKNNTSYQMYFTGSGYFQDMIRSWKSNYEEGSNAYGGTASFARFAAKEPRVRWTNGTTNSSSAGTFNVGDILYYDTPVAGGYIGRVCTVAGTPGTWKDFGAINA